MNKCKWFGHKWEPVYIKGEIETHSIKFIGCQCSRCLKGNRELLNVLGSMSKIEMNTFNEKYFEEKV